MLLSISTFFTFERKLKFKKGIFGKKRKIKKMRKKNAGKISRFYKFPLAFLSEPM